MEENDEKVTYMYNLLETVRQNGVDLYITIVDLYITIVDYNRNLYVPEPFKYHTDYQSYQLVFTFEDRTGIVGDGKEHIQTVAEYVNANNVVLIKLQDDDFGSLLEKLRKWCETHRTAR